MATKTRTKISSLVPKVGRHESHCTICSHPQRDEIDDAFVSWNNASTIVTKYKLRDRSAIYRHAHATGLMAKRDRNLHAALGRIIENVDDVTPTAASIIQAIALLAKINTRGELVEHGDRAGVHELFGQMTPAEMEAYAHSGTLPAWFPRSMAPKDSQGTGGDKNE